MHANTNTTVIRFAALMFGLGLLFNNCQAFESRPLPANAILGTLKLAAMPNIVIDGQPCTLTAGAQIRDQNNLIVQTGALSGPDVNVLYKKSRQGQIDRIWILTSEEYQRIINPVTPPPLMPVNKTGN